MSEDYIPMSTTIEPTSHPQAEPLPKVKLAKPTLDFRASRRKRGGFRALGWKLLVLVSAIVAISWAANRWYFTESAQAAEITALVVRTDLPIAVTERGELESSKTTDVRCEVEGYQNKIVMIVPEGTHVKKDQVVVTFDTDQLKRQHDDQEVKWKTAEGRAKAAKGALEVEKNKAATEIDKADLALTLAELDLKKYVEGEYKVALDKASGEIELAKKDLHEAKDKLEHYRKFVRQGFGTQDVLRLKELEVARNEYMLSSKEAEVMVLKEFTKLRQETELTAKARDAKRELQRAKSTGEAAVDKAHSELYTAEVGTRLEKQALDRAKKQLEKCVVKAPEDGILVYSKDRFWDPSSRVQPGAMVHYQQTLFSLPELLKMQVKVKIHEAMVKKLKIGQKAEIRVESYPNAVLHGTVEKVATLANSEGYWDERGVKEYLTIVKVDDLPPEAGLKPGMSAEVKILVNQLPNVLIVPVQAVSQREGQHYSYVQSPKGIARRDVTIGENNEKFVEVQSGLEEGERVVLDARARSAAEAKAEEAKTDNLPKPGDGKTNAAPASGPVTQPVSPSPGAAAPAAAKEIKVSTPVAAAPPAVPATKVVQTPKTTTPAAKKKP
jgi:RND family efflux transporter MFP subunit